MTPIVDAHAHLLDLAFGRHERLHRSLGGLTDVPLMRAGGGAAQLTACWTPEAEEADYAGGHALHTLLGMAAYLHDELEGEAGAYVALATRAGDIERAQAAGKIALILGLEGANALDGDAGLVRILYRLGFRHLGPVHVGRNAFGCATFMQAEDGAWRAFDAARDGPGGLTPAGRQLIGEMNRLGMLVDVAHMEPATFWDAIATTRRPVIASHAGARAVTDCRRYFDDEQIAAVARTGGVVCASPTPLTLCDEAPGLETLLRHIDHLVRRAGAGHVGIGSDFLDSAEMRPPGFEDAGQTAGVQAGLLRRGYGAEDAAQILGGNVLRLFNAVV